MRKKGNSKFDIQQSNEFLTNRDDMLRQKFKSPGTTGYSGIYPPTIVSKLTTVLQKEYQADRRPAEFEVSVYAGCAAERQASHP